MNMHPRNLFQRRHTLTIALLAALFAALMGLTQCRMVDKNVTGVDVRGNATYGDDKDDRSRRQSLCERRCEREYKRCRRAEERAHDDALDACRDLDEKGDRRACRRAERERHEDALRDCRADLRQCKRECRYQEGGGTGGR